MDSDLLELSQGGSFEGSVEVSVDHAAVKITVSSYGSVLVPEPLGGYFTDVISGHVADSGGHFASGNDPIDVGNLSSVFV